MTIDSGLATLIAAIVAISGGAFAYWNQKRLDRRSDLISKRQDAYARLLNRLMGVMGADGPAIYNEARMELTLVASDRVLRAAKDFFEYGVKTSQPGIKRDMHLFKNFLANLVLEMRKDVFENSRLSREELKSILPIEE